MTDEKRNRIKAAITINAVLLVFILLVIIIAQIITMGVLTHRRNQLNAERESWEQELAKTQAAYEGLQDEERFEELIALLEADENYYNTVMQMLHAGMNPWENNS